MRKRHKIGHIFGLVGDRWKHGHKSASILQAFLHRLSENTKQAITFCKNKTIHFFVNYFFLKFIFFFNSGRARVNRAGHKPVRARVNVVLGVCVAAGFHAGCVGRHRYEEARRVRTALDAARRHLEDNVKTVMQWRADLKLGHNANTSRRRWQHDTPHDTTCHVIII